MKRKTTINPVVELMTSRIEFEFRQNSESTDKVESMIQSLVQEAQKSRDAEIAIERLTEREDQLGIISKSIVERECQNR